VDGAGASRPHAERGVGRIADRVVHHALFNLIEPLFEGRFISDSYANRPGKGTHLAVDRLQAFAKRYCYVLRLDIVKHLPSIDHAILLQILAQEIRDEGVLDLAARIVVSGDGVLEYEMVWFPGDDLLAACRPRGLPIGNLTSQFWSNCYLHPLDLFIKRELGCRAYLRYVDDMALFADSKSQLWDWKQAIVERLASLRLTAHPGSAQVAPVSAGVPWLGFVVFPAYRRVKSRKAVQATRRLTDRFDAWRNGAISFAELDASVKGWINHVRYADSWGLREHVLSRFVWGPNEIQREARRARCEKSA
jgi:RNA-directed DNA polymerase